MGVFAMTNINITNFRKNIFEYMNQAIEFNDVVNVNTKKGNAIIISESDYNALMETLHISSVKGLVDEIKEAGATPLSECIPENEVEW